MALGRIARAACLLAGVALLSVSCVTTSTPVTAGAGRLQAIDGLEAVNTVLNRRTGRTILVYHSPRCDFCRGILRSAEAVLPDLGPQDVIYTLDTDSNPEVRSAMGIGPVPVVVFLRDGREVKRWRLYRPGFIARGAIRRFFAP
jgi:thioredoxin-like negative regulator of GroEL